MSITRFAMICDHCGKRGPEYEPMPSCRECLDDVCPGCCWSVEEGDEGRYINVLCKRCHNDPSTADLDAVAQEQQIKENTNVQRKA